MKDKKNKVKKLYDYSDNDIAFHLLFLFVAAEAAQQEVELKNAGCYFNTVLKRLLKIAEERIEDLELEKQFLVEDSVQAVKIVIQQNRLKSKNKCN